jgi:hypothetical protein|nr:MAG TPA: hypothetical protein [Caudoviricetes sp.]
MNKEELLKEFNEKVEQLRDEFISKLEDDKKEFEVELPEDGEKLYFIRDLYGTVSSKIFNINTMSDIKRFENGLYFETEEEAKQRLKEQRLLFKIKKWAEIHNEGWEPDWSDDEKKWYVYYNHVEERLNVTWGYNSTNFAKLPYFKTREIAQECIDLFGDEIKEVFC